jgi:transposase
VRGTRVWARLLGLVGAVVEDVQIGDEEAIVVAARPGWRERDRCGICWRRGPGFDFGDGRRRWRALDLGATLAFVEADAPRVTCWRHGVVVCAVPWARHNSRFTRACEDQAVRHEALLNRVGCRAPRPGCRSSPVKLGAA